MHGSQIRQLDNGEFAIFEGDEQVEQIYFVGPRPPSDELVTSKGTPVASLVSWNGRCFSVGSVRYCEYFARGEQCKFCNYNATYEDARAIGSDRAVAIDLEETVEAYKIVSSTVRLV